MDGLGGLLLQLKILKSGPKQLDVYDSEENQEIEFLHGDSDTSRTMFNEGLRC